MPLFQITFHCGRSQIKILPNSYPLARQERMIESLRMVCNQDCRVLHHPRNMGRIYSLSHAHAPGNGLSVFCDGPCAHHQKQGGEGMREYQGYYWDTRNERTMVSRDRCLDPRVSGTMLLMEQVSEKHYVNLAG